MKCRVCQWWRDPWGTGRAARRAGRLVVVYVLAPLWRGLVAYGSMFDPEAGSRPLHEVLRPAVRLCGPGPGHPERVCPQVPLSQVELLLVREVWPDHQPGRSGPVGS